jgi:hypothetical protein
MRSGFIQEISKTNDYFLSSRKVLPDLLQKNDYIALLSCFMSGRSNFTKIFMSMHARVHGSAFTGLIN